jgi:hypothetical protein
LPYKDPSIQGIDISLVSILLTSNLKKIKFPVSFSARFLQVSVRHFLLRTSCKVEAKAFIAFQAKARSLASRGFGEHGTNHQTQRSRLPQQQHLLNISS